MRELTIQKNDADQRLDRFLGKAVPLLPASLAQKYIRLKRIKVNGARAERDYRLREGDLLAYLYQKREWKPREENAFTPALCNRIDRNTGGIVIAAKNAEALRVLNEKIRERELSKFYLCICLGRPEPPKGRIECFLRKDSKTNTVRVYHHPVPDGRSAVTLYETLETRDRLSLVEVELLTGRTHQIRASFADMGHPLLGDGKYGVGSVNRRYGETQQALYSYRLRFDFPTDAGILNYLRGREFIADEVPFRRKYFG